MLALELSESMAAILVTVVMAFALLITIRWWRRNAVVGEGADGGSMIVAEDGSVHSTAVLATELEALFSTAIVELTERQTASGRIVDPVQVSKDAIERARTQLMEKYRLPPMQAERVERRLSRG